MTLRVTSVIMAYTNCDQLKRSIDNLEKYRLIAENKLKQFILKEFNQCSSILRNDHAGRRNISFTHTTPINSRRKKQSRDVFQKFFASVVQSWSGLH